MRWPWQPNPVPEDERLPHHGRSLMLRALLGCFIVFVLSTVAAATAGLLQVSDLVNELGRGGPHISDEGITRADAGSPQTILVLGSDRRFSDLAKNNKLIKHNLPARSDTIMLIRLDPDQPVTSVLSIPRDLKVHIPGFGTDKINAAYSDGGPTLTLKTIKDLTGLDINHVVNINFHGFRDVVNAIGCVYVDVDRKYYHSNLGLAVGQRYAEINIEPGYQKLCGTDALNYVRYRHTDSDIVRAARQQAFLREMKDQVSAGKLFSEHNKLISIFGRNTQTDKSLDSSAGLISILKLALYSAGHPVRQIQFPANNDIETLPGGAQIDYLSASPEAIRRTVERFLHPPKQTAQPKIPTPPGKHRQKPKHHKVNLRGLYDAQRQGEDLLAPIVAHHHEIPIYFPKYLTSTSHYDTTEPVRVYTLHDRAAKLRHAYRIVVASNVVLGEYWGVQGTDWYEPPLLQAVHSRITRHGRRLAVYKDGSRIRIVAWHSGKDTYWVSNTLTNSLTNTQMLEIGSTLTRRFS